MKTQDPDGTTWTVRRRITPWRRYFAGSFDGIGLESQNAMNHGHLGTSSGPAGAGGGDSSYFTALIRIPFLAIVLPFSIAMRLLLRVDALINQIRSGDYPSRTTIQSLAPDPSM